MIAKAKAEHLDAIMNIWLRAKISDTHIRSKFKHEEHKMNWARPRCQWAENHTGKMGN